jgi:hypothetical protein
MLIKYTIQNSFQEVTGATNTLTGGSINNLYKSVLIPIEQNFYPVDYSEDIQKLVTQEINKSTNPIFDGETIKYNFNDLNANNKKGLLISFNFFNGDFTNPITGIDYTLAGFVNTDIIKNKNGFKKSFFRLYFYDSNSGETSSLIFTEDIDVDYSLKPEFSLNRLYWLRNDQYFVKNNTNRVLYMDARFFNAKTGKTHRFINPPIGTTLPIDITDYNKPNNKDWRTSRVEFINPKNNNGSFNFLITPNVGANTNNTITMTEFILK